VICALETDKSDWKNTVAEARKEGITRVLVTGMERENGIE
jgi:hypothetical protein